MNVRLTAQQADFVKRQVAEGRYLTASEVIREGLRLLAEEMEWRAEVRRRVAEGMKQLRAGELLDGEQAVAEILEELQERRRTERG